MHNQNSGRLRALSLLGGLGAGILAAAAPSYVSPRQQWRTRAPRASSGARAPYADAAAALRALRRGERYRRAHDKPDDFGDAWPRHIRENGADAWAYLDRHGLTGEAAEAAAQDLAQERAR